MLWIAADCLPIEVGEHVLPQLLHVPRVYLRVRQVLDRARAHARTMLTQPCELGLDLMNLAATRD